MIIFSVFDNNSDVGTNLLVAGRLGHRKSFLAAESHFENMGVVCHKHRIFRQDATKPWHARTMSNLFGDIPGMGKFPVIYGLPQ